MDAQEAKALAEYLNGRGLSTPDSVVLLAWALGEILAAALREGCTDTDEVDRTVARMAAAIRQQTGITARAH